MTGHTSATKHKYLVSFIIFIIIISLTWPIVQCDNSTTQASDLLNSKLDLLLERLDQLNKTLISSNSACSCQQSNTSNSSSAIISKRETTATTTTTRQADEEPTVGRDLFHFNKLADNLIPASSTSQEHVDSETTKGTILAIGHHYESLFGSALENLNLIVKEQLTGFRLTLNKLMNRLIDHNYQHNVLANQLALVKEECSLAGSYLISQVANSNNVNNSNNNEKVEQSISNVRETTATTTTTAPSNTLRSSDISIIVRLLTEEFERLRVSKYSTNNQDQVSSSSVLESLQRRLDVIDSVVKQTAQQVSRLSGAPEKATTLTYTNANELNTTATTTTTPQRSRWFSGSKVPNTKPAPQGESSDLPVQRVQKCQAKTNLIRPTSCRQLREAGANCTGQYYVFVRGQIRHVYCDMNMDPADDGGGWTVILRRLDKSLGGGEVGSKSTPFSSSSSSASHQWLEAIRSAQVDFRQDFANYKSGFGYLDNWSEFFVGLELLYQLVSGGDQRETTTTSVCELQLDLVTNSSSQLNLRFESIQLGGESELYQLHLGACNATHQTAHCEPLASLNQTKFVDQFPATSSWWRRGWQPAEQQQFNFTQNLAKSSHLYWPTWRADEPIRELVLKVRQKRAAPIVV